MPTNYNSSVTYWRVNANNNAIATSASGDGVATEQIESPVVGGLYASGSATTTIIGQSGADFTLFDEGQYLYYIDNSGNYVLMGLIDTIDSATQLTLTANSTGTPIANQTLVAGYSLITSTESIFIRLQVAVNQNNANQRDIPDFSAWRTASGVANPSNNTYSRLEQVSSVGSPLTPATVTTQPFTFQTMNILSSYVVGSARLYFQTTTAFPAYIWIKATPRPTNNTSSLSSQTMYRWATEETIPAATIYVGTPESILSTAGYSNLGGVVTAGGTTGQA